jgi:hypothetical protein
MKISRFAFIGMMLFSFLNWGTRPAHCQTQITKVNAANSWRFFPVDPATQRDPVGSSLRETRNAFWSSVLDTLSPRGPYGSARVPGPVTLSHPEFPKDPSAVWAIGDFQGYRVIPIENGRGAYTEIQFLVQVVISPGSSPISAGNVVDIAMIGGTVIDPNHKVVTSMLDPERFALRPRHSYLLELTYDSSGDFYAVGKHWDVTSGRVVPDDAIEVAREKAGKSQIASLPLAEVLPRMKSILAAQQNEK